MKLINFDETPTSDSHWAVNLGIAVSGLLGWCYFLAWSTSFYPQLYLNIKLRSTAGWSYDYSLANCLGFIAYSISTGAFLWSPAIRAQYAQRHPRQPETTVRLNDFIYAFHAAGVCLFMHSQFFPKLWGWEKKQEQRFSATVLTICSLSVASVGITVIIVAIFGRDGGYDASTWAWIDVIYVISYIKLILTIFKYLPQYLLNYRRKSTVGFSIEVILLDFLGGILSILQLFIDAGLEGDWAGVTGNQAKLWLGNITLIFDLMFIFQHYVTYRKRKDQGEVRDRTATSRETDPLLASNS